MKGGEWTARPWVARLIRVAVVVVPALVGVLTAWGLAGLLFRPSGVAETTAWLVILIGVTVLVVVVTQRLVRRALPLAWLLSLSLAFPDQAPSRLRTAHRAASRRELRQTLGRVRQEGLGAGPGAAEAALVLVAALGTHDRLTRGHSERVRILADVLAEEAGVAAEDRSRLRWAALLHDIGKLSVPGEILNKPDRPDELEWATLRRHPEEGKRLVEPLVTWLGLWAGAVADHHERWDGSGYPRGLSGEEISLGGRILAVADAYEVMTAARPYKQAVSPPAARSELVAGAGSQFDPALVRSFLGVGLGKLWWIAGVSAVLAQVPLIGWLWTTPAGAQTRKTGVGPAVAASALAVVAVAGGLAPAEGETPRRPGAQATAAPSAPVSVDPPETTTTAPPLVSGSAAPEKPVPPPARAVPRNRGPAPVAAPPNTPSITPLPRSVPPPAPTAPAAPPPATPPARERTLYTGSGQLLAPVLVASLGVTETEFRLRCATPVTQGLDGMVLDLPAAARVAGAFVRVSEPEEGLHVGFYSGRCTELGRLSPGGEPTAVPEGTRFLVVTANSGLSTQFKLVVVAAG